jgi:signal transduction histidine kinase
MWHAMPSDVQRRTVLIVDDTPGNLVFVMDHLERHGLRVVVAQDGEEALKRAQYAHPGLILLDVIMPGIDGFETCRRLKSLEETRGIPVIFMTGVADAEAKVTGFKVGGVDYVTKPLQPEEVLARVTTHLRLRELTEDLERKVREQTMELQVANERLRDADRRKDEFLSMLSHELRNPLAAIACSVHILNHADPQSEPAKRAVMIVGRQTKHLTRLIDDLLDVTRVARGKMELYRELVDLRELVRRTGDDFRVMMDSRGIEFLTEMPREGIWIDGDPTRLAQVVGNLLQNAAKFTEPGGRVSLALDALHGHHVAEIRVRDTGVGIEPEVLAHLFEPFVQGSRSLARTQGGLGLGLTLVKGLTELHGGTVRVESPGPVRGSEFVVRLPLVPSNRAQDAPDRSVRPLAHSHRVLVVDDNRDAAESMAELVKTFGHVCEVTYDGPSALANIRTNPPDVVLCDIGLPGMSGYEVARALRAGGSGIRLIAVSGYARPEDIKRAAESGFDGHVAKPPDPAQIEQVLA